MHSKKMEFCYWQDDTLAYDKEMRGMFKRSKAFSIKVLIKKTYQELCEFLVALFV